MGGLHVAWRADKKTWCTICDVPCQLIVNRFTCPTCGRQFIFTNHTFTKKPLLRVNRLLKAVKFIPKQKE
jgi:predicted RNA-binding Zn-ribbon protein involved in translation (DUF1610 family)